MKHENNLIISTQGRLGMICLDRTPHLNALSIAMIQGIDQQLQHWRDAAEVDAILISSNSAKAFCAGGDFAICMTVIKPVIHSIAIILQPNI